MPWYEQLFDAKPVLDEDTGPFRHVVWALGSTLVGLHESRMPDPRPSTSAESGSTTSPAPTAESWSSGRHG